MKYTMKERLNTRSIVASVLLFLIVAGASLAGFTSDVSAQQPIDVHDDLIIVLADEETPRETPPSPPEDEEDEEDDSFEDWDEDDNDEDDEEPEEPEED